MATKHGYTIDPNQELIAQGAACTAAGLVGGYATDGSLSKTSVADAAGQRTQMASILNAALVLLTMLFLASLFEDLPAAALGAIVIDAMVGLISFGEMRRYCAREPRGLRVLHERNGRHPVRRHHPRHHHRRRALAPHADRKGLQAADSPLARNPEDGSYVDFGLHSRLDIDSKVLTFRLDGPLFFADAQRFKEAVFDLIETVSEPPEAMVLDADSISLTDTDGADALIDLVTDFARSEASSSPSRVCNRRYGSCGRGPGSQPSCSADGTSTLSTLRSTQ